MSRFSEIRKNSNTPEMVSIIRRCRKSKDLQYQKDVSYLLMRIRQKEHEYELSRKRD